MHVPLSTVRRKRHHISAITAVAAMLAAVIIPVSSAAAATSAPAASAKASTSASTAAKAPATSQAAAKPAAAKPVDVPAKPTGQSSMRPNPQVKRQVFSSVAGTATKPAAKSATVRSAVADTCSGAISPDVVYPCDTPSATGTDTFTINLTSSNDLLFFELVSASSNGAAFASVMPPGSTTATTCFPELRSGIGQCATSGPGAYTVQVPSNGVDYTLSYISLLSDPNCTAAALSFTAAAKQLTVAPGAAGACLKLPLAAGDTFQYAWNTTSSYNYTGVMAVYDATGTQVCIDNLGTCVLTGTGPYRVLFSADDQTGYTDTVQLTSLTNPTGCIAVAQQVYATVPDKSSADQCREIVVTTAGNYQVYSTNDYAYATTLYNEDGSVACTNYGTFCQLAAGTYNFVEATDLPTTPVHFGLVFINASETSGCTASGDTDFASGAVAGTFAGLGEELCFTLPTASGESVYLLDEEDAGNNIPFVLDSTGTEQCYSYYQNNDVCALTGTGPFNFITSDLGPNAAAYRFLIQRTDSTDGCTSWPQSGFGGTWGATVNTVASHYNYDCLAIPADDHSTGEMIDYSDTTNTEDGGISVADPTGTTVCTIFTTGVCSYTAGVAYTAILDNSGQKQTYHLVRRDVSSSAQCNTPASTVPGGPTTPIDLTSSLDTECYQVTAAATDDLLFATDTIDPGNATSTLQVANASGAIVCRQFGDDCQVTGSTSYQVLVTATNYSGITIAVNLDTWRVATAAGWAPQCTANQLSTAGWPTITGTFTQAAAGYCAVVSYQPNQYFTIYGNQLIEQNFPFTAVGMYTTADWNQGLGLCNEGAASDYGIGCQTNGLTAGQAVLFAIPGGTSQYPSNYDFEGICQQGCTTPPGQALVTSISPAKQAAGSHQVVITGSNLNLGTQVTFESETPGAFPTYTWPVSVNAAGTQFTVGFDSTYMTTGKYDVILNGVGRTTGTASPGYLPNAYTVTAAPAPTPTSNFVALTPTQAYNAQVGADSAETVQVAGVGGVPATGATAVALDLTATQPTASGTLTAYPDGKARPGTSALQFHASLNATNLAVVPVTDGAVDLYNNSTGTVGIEADVVGYYTEATGVGAAFTPLAATQIYTSGTSQTTALAADSTTVIPVEGLGGVPATSDVTAALLNVQSVSPTATGTLTVYADGTTQPTATAASFNAGKSSSSLVSVPITNGNIDVYNNSTGTTNLVVSVVGYYSSTGNGYQNLDGRVLDTRTGLGNSGETVPAHGAAVLQIVNTVPYSATAVLLNVKVLSAQKAGTLTVFSDGQPIPSTSNVNFGPGLAESNLVLVPVVNGWFDFYNNSGGTVQIVADVEGYYTS